MAKEVIRTDQAPQAIGPYSQAIKAGGFIFISGQLPINPKNGEINGDIKVQTKQVLENIKSVLSSVDASLQDVVKTTVFLKDLNDFNSMNEVFLEYFVKDAPARACVEVSRIPKGALIEIESLAIVKY